MLNARLKEARSGAQRAEVTRVNQLDAFKHGSRYYNVKQLRDEGVCVSSRLAVTTTSRGRSSP